MFWWQLTSCIFWLEKLDDCHSQLNFHADCFELLKQVSKLDENTWQVPSTFHEKGEL